MADRQPGGRKFSPFVKLIKILKSSLTPDNINDIKFVLAGVIPSGELDRVSGFLDIIKILEQKRLIKRENLDVSYLEEVLEFCNRTDLQIVLKDFVEKNKGTFNTQALIAKSPFTV